MITTDKTKISHALLLISCIGLFSSIIFGTIFLIFGCNPHVKYGCPLSNVKYGVITNFTGVQCITSDICAGYDVEISYSNMQYCTYQSEVQSGQRYTYFNIAQYKQQYIIGSGIDIELDSDQKCIPFD